LAISNWTARNLDVPLYSADRRLVERFPHRARLLGD
jgi:predicted nucleic acid-binding protein